MPIVTYGLFVGRLRSNNTFEQTVEHRGRAVLAMNCVLGGAVRARCLAAQLNR